MIIKVYQKEITPVMIHAAGKIEFNEIWFKLMQLPVKKWHQSQSIAVVTWHQKTTAYEAAYKNLGLFESYCDRLGVKCSVLNSAPWTTNRLKIPTTLEFLRTCKENFIVGADSSDVFAYGLPNPDILDSYECDMLFNAEIQFWPAELGELKSQEEKYAYNQFAYLNSGLWIARRKYAIEVFELLNSMYEKNAFPKFTKSDQVLFKHCYIENYPRIKIDTECKVFFNCSHIKAQDVEFQSISHKALL